MHFIFYFLTLITRKKSFKATIAGVLIGLGFYMPFDIVLTYTIGNLLRILCDRFAGKRFSEQVGIPIAAGLIVGEALVGVGYAFYQIFLG